MTNPLHASLYIDGRWAEALSGDRFDVINPRDESIAGTAANAGPQDVEAAVTAARAAFDTTEWSRDHAFRRHCLLQLKEGLRTEIAAIKNTLISEAGLCARYLPMHVEAQIDDIDWMADTIASFEWERDLPAYTMGNFVSLKRVRQEAYGVAGAITPWNGPFTSNIWKTTHLLASGNTMVLKTAPDTPLTGALLAKVIDEHTDIPRGVFNVISSLDKGAAGEALTGDPRVDMFHFTGSPETGRRIAERAATGIRKVVLELGGKSANIVLDDADLDSALPMSVMRCMSTSGQGCSLPTRMIVHASIYDEAVERLISIMQDTPWGDPRKPETMVGPIIRQDQLDRMHGLVERAARDGARVAAGGEKAKVDGKGFWYLPTLIVDAGENSEIAQTEVFGPVLTVLRYDGDDAEAVRMANNTRYGLAGYVQTASPDRAEWIAQRLRSGTVAIGASSIMGPDSPFGGYGISGLGREHGLEGFRECLQTKTIARPAQ